MTAKEKIRERILLAILGEPSFDSSEAQGLTDEIMQLIEPEIKLRDEIIISPTLFKARIVARKTEVEKFFSQMKGGKEV